MRLKKTCTNEFKEKIQTRHGIDLCENLENLRQCQVYPGQPFDTFTLTNGSLQLLVISIKSNKIALSKNNMSNIFVPKVTIFSNNNFSKFIKATL